MNITNLKPSDLRVNALFENFRTAETYPLEYHYAKLLFSILDPENPLCRTISEYLKAQKFFDSAVCAMANALRLPEDAKGEKSFFLGIAKETLNKAILTLREHNLTYTWLYKFCLRNLDQINAEEGVL